MSRSVSVPFRCTCLALSRHISITRRTLRVCGEAARIAAASGSLLKSALDGNARRLLLLRTYERAPLNRDLLRAADLLRTEGRREAGSSL